MNTTTLKNPSIDGLTGYELAEIRAKGVINGDLNRDLAINLLAKYFNNGRSPDATQLQFLDRVLHDVQVNLDDNENVIEGNMYLREHAKALMVVSLMT